MVSADGEAPHASADDEAARAHRNHQVNMICAHMGLNVASLCIGIVPRVSIVQETGGLSAAGAAKLLALYASGVGVVEFLLNPISGRLSDACGRKVFLMQAPAVSALLKYLVYLRPSKFSVGLERCVAGACTTIGGSTACSSALADILKDPKELSQAYALLGASAGLGVIIGPLIGGLAIGRSGIARRAFSIGAVFSALQLVLVSAQIPETLAPRDRRAMPGRELLSTMNPLTMLQLFTNGSVVARLVSIAALQCFCEGKAISDLNTYYLLNDAKFTAAQRSLYISCFGVVMTAAGMIGRRTIDIFGMRGHTTLQNLASVVGFSLMGSTTLMPVIFGSLLLYAFAMERRAAVSSLAVKAAITSGMGNGEFSAAFANLRAIVVGVAPLLYARLYAWGRRANSPGLPYFAAGAIALVAEAVHRTMRNKQLEFK